MPEMVTIPRAEYERLLKAQAYVENDRDRSRRNKTAKKHAEGPVPIISSDRSNGSHGPVAAISRDRSQQAEVPVTAISRDRSQPPDRSDLRPVALSLSDRSSSRANGFNSPGSHLSAAAAAAFLKSDDAAVAREGDRSAGDNCGGSDPPVEDVWRTEPVLAAIRPGVDLELERAKMVAKLGARAAGQLWRVIRWVENAWPPMAPPHSNGRGEPRPGPALTAFAFEGPWTADHPPPISAIDQARISRGAAG